MHNICCDQSAPIWTFELFLSKLQARDRCCEVQYKHIWEVKRRSHGCKVHFLLSFTPKVNPPPREWATISTPTSTSRHGLPSTRKKLHARDSDTVLLVSRRLRSTTSLVSVQFWNFIWGNVSTRHRRTHLLKTPTHTGRSFHTQSVLRQLHSQTLSSHIGFHQRSQTPAFLRSAARQLGSVPEIVKLVKMINKLKFKQLEAASHTGAIQRSACVCLCLSACPFLREAAFSRSIRLLIPRDCRNHSSLRGASNPSRHKFNPLPCLEKAIKFYSSLLRSDSFNPISVIETEASESRDSWENTKIW